MSTIQELRDAALKDCKQPSRYTSDEGVFGNPEETRKVEAEWTAYFKMMYDIMIQYPFEKKSDAGPSDRDGSPPRPEPVLKPF